MLPQRLQPRRHNWPTPDVWSASPWLLEGAFYHLRVRRIFLANCSMAVRKRMQRIHDSAVCLVRPEPARSHAAPQLHCLHWLPVHTRIMYKLCRCVLMFDFTMTWHPRTWPTCVVAVTITVSAHQHVVILLCDGQGHALLTAYLLLQVRLHGTHCSSHPEQ